jgi:hypothetical protein
MAELHIKLDDDLNYLMDIYMRMVHEYTGIERDKAEFAALMCGIGLMTFSRSISPRTEEDMHELILSIMSEAPERAGFLQKAYALMKAQADKKTGFVK